MDKFIQMDIFFFITSVIGFVVLFFAVLIGIYAFLITKKFYKLTKSLEEFVTHVSKKGSEASDILSEKFESLIKETGVVPKIVKSLFTIVVSKIVHGTIKKDAKKKKDKENY